MRGGVSVVIDRRIEMTALHESGREFPIELAITRVSLSDPEKFEFCAFNAVKYSPGGGTVGFDVHAGEQVFTFQVRDQGIGIRDADLPRLFETFHRAVNVGNIVGTGLGLAIVKRSVDLHCGTLAVSSAPGQGTLFKVSLPRINT